MDVFEKCFYANQNRKWLGAAANVPTAQVPHKNKQHLNSLYLFLH